MNYEQNFYLFTRMFGDILPKDKNFNHLKFLEEFETYFIKPLVGKNLYLASKQEVDKVYIKAKKVLSFVDCIIEHDEFHKVYNCTLSFKKYNKVYQKIDLNLRYNKSYLLTLYYHQHMRKYINAGEQINLAYLFMGSRNHCNVCLEYDNKSYYSQQPESTYFIVDNTIYEHYIHQDFNNSSLSTFTSYDGHLNIKKFDYFCVGDYTFSISLCNEKYSVRNYSFHRGEDISHQLVAYLNTSGLSLLEFTVPDFLMCDAYAC